MLKKRLDLHLGTCLFHYIFLFTVEECDKSDMKIKEKWFGKQNKKEDEACDKEGELRGW